MCGEIEVAHVASLGQVSGGVAVVEEVALFGLLEPATRGFGIRVANEENAVSRLLDHALGQVVGRGVLGEHPGGHDEQPVFVELDPGGLIAAQYGEVKRLVQLKVRVLAVGPVGLQVVNLCEHPAQSADEYGLLFKSAGLHLQGQRAENFLRSAQRECGDEGAAATLERFLDGAD